MKIDILIVTQNRTKLLARCLESLCRASRVAGATVEISVCLSGGDKVTRETILRFGEVRLFETAEPLAPAAARNRILTAADGDWVFFIDDDAYVDADFFSRFEVIQRDYPEAAVIGGPNLTPPGSSLLQRACGIALSSRFGAATSSARYISRRKSIEQCGDERLISCNLFVRRAALAGKRFCEGLVSNEENWLLQDLLRDNAYLVYEPTLFVWHERRSSIGLFLSQIYRYGRGRGQNLRHRPRTLPPFHIVPTLCVIFTFFALLTSPFLIEVAEIWLALFVAYIFALLFISCRFRLVARQSTLVSVLSGLLFPLIHLAYGVGLLYGFSAANESL